MRLLLLRALPILIAIASLPVAATPAGADETVVVQPGDNVYRIALRHGTSISSIVRANGLGSADRIYTGQRLQVPGASPSTGVGTGGSALASGAPTYIVQPGDTLLRIAVRSGTTVQALVAANGLPAPDRIFVGQRIIVPGGVTAAVGGPAAISPAQASAGREIVVDLSSQTLSAVDNGLTVRTFVVSTGAAASPTPLGRYRIANRYATQHMSGPGYNLPGVPYVQYFTGAFAIHGTYWHASFGTPVSHGCVNMRSSDAGWLWRWSAVGTPVVVRW